MQTDFLIRIHGSYDKKIV